LFLLKICSFVVENNNFLLLSLENFLQLVTLQCVSFLITGGDSITSGSDNHTSFTLNEISCFMTWLHLLLIISLLFTSTLLTYFLSFSSSRESRYIGQQLSAIVICRMLMSSPHPTICGPILGPLGMFFVRLFRTTSFACSSDW